jgi:hypothetical protein
MQFLQQNPDFKFVWGPPKITIIHKHCIGNVPGPHKVCKTMDDLKFGNVKSEFYIIIIIIII